MNVADRFVRIQCAKKGVVPLIIGAERGRCQLLHGVEPSIEVFVDHAGPSVLLAAPKTGAASCSRAREALNTHSFQTATRIRIWNDFSYAASPLHTLRVAPVLPQRERKAVLQGFSVACLTTSRHSRSAVSAQAAGSRLSGLPGLRRPDDRPNGERYGGRRLVATRRPGSDDDEAARRGVAHGPTCRHPQPVAMHARFLACR